ncbi:hypothetical protein ACLKA6_015278 [Drosophila palustris]
MALSPECQSPVLCCMFAFRIMCDSNQSGRCKWKLGAWGMIHGAVAAKSLTHAPVALTVAVVVVDLAFKINDRLPTMHKGESQKVWSRLCYLAAEAYAPWGGPWLPGSGSYDEGVGIV